MHISATAMVVIVMLQRWDSSGSDSAVITMCTLVRLRWQLTNGTVTALSVATTFTVSYEFRSGDRLLVT